MFLHSPPSPTLVDTTGTSVTTIIRMARHQTHQGEPPLQPPFPIASYPSISKGWRTPLSSSEYLAQSSTTQLQVSGMTPPEIMSAIQSSIRNLQHHQHSPQSTQSTGRGDAGKHWFAQRETLEVRPKDMHRTGETTLSTPTLSDQCAAM